MPTYASYVASQVPQQAILALSRWADSQLLNTSLEEIVGTLCATFRIRPLVYAEEEYADLVTQNVPREGVRVRLRLKNPDDASGFFNLTPSRHASAPDFTVEGPYLEFVVREVKAATDITRPLSAIKANIDAANQDIERADKDLIAHLTNVAQSAVRAARDRQAESARALRALAESGLEVRGMTGLEGTAPAADSALRVALRVVQDPVELSTALATLRELEQVINSGVDRGDIDPDIANFEILPLIRDLQRLLPHEAVDVAERLGLVQRAHRMLGGLQYLTRAAAGVAGRAGHAATDSPAAWIVALADGDEAIENVGRLVEAVQTILVS